MPNITKKHYVAIADRIATHTPADHPATKEYRRAVGELALSLADYFESDNPRFDRARFLEACGVEEHTLTGA